MDEKLDYAGIYKTLTTNVKRGFLKRHTPEDYGGDFMCMARNLEKQNCPDLAAVFLLGKAKHESNQNNPVAEASTLFSAAKYFIKAQDDNECINAVTYDENLDSAVFCFLRAAKIYETRELFTLAANVYIYLSDTLMRYKKWTATLPYLKRGLEIISSNFLLRLQLLKRIVTCQLNMRDWPGALCTCLRIQLLLVDKTSLNGSCLRSREEFDKYWVDTEIFRVLLILLTSPSVKADERKTSGYSLQAYLSDDIFPSPDSNFPYEMNEELFLQLKSFVLAAYTRDVVDLDASSGALQSFLSVSQRELLTSFLNEICNPHGSSLWTQTRPDDAIDDNEDP